MKKKLTPLFELLKSLTIGEKRSFRQLVNYTTTKDKQYLQLFDILDNMAIYDEEKLKTKLKTMDIATPLPYLSNYLQDLILKSLRFYNSENNIDGQINDYIKDATILHRKGLEKLRDKSLRKAKKLAVTYEKKTLLLEILNKEWRFQALFPTQGVTEGIDVTANLNIQQQYRQLNFIKTELLSKGEIRDKHLKQEWDTLIHDPLISISDQSKGYEESYHYHNILARYYVRTKDFEKSLEHQRQLINWLESRMDLLDDFKEVYMFELNVLIITYCLKHDFDAAYTVLSKLLGMQTAKLYPNESVTLTDVILIAYSNIIHNYFLSGFYKKAIELVVPTELFLKTNKVSGHHKSFVYLNIAKVYIYKGDSRTAHTWNNKIINATVEKKLDNFYVLSRILDLIINFELESNELLQSRVNSVVHVLEKRKQLYKTETIILKYLRDRFPKSTSRKEALPLFIEMKAELEEIKKDFYEARAFEYFDYCAWLESKIKNKTLLDVSKKSDKIKL